MQKKITSIFKMDIAIALFITKEIIKKPNFTYQIRKMRA